MTVSRPRLLLLEFLTPGRRPSNSRLFPFLKGAAASLGVASRTLCFGYRPGRKPGFSPAPDAELEVAELEILTRHLEELGPTHVLSSHRISDRIAQLLASFRVSFLVLEPLLPGETDPGIRSALFQGPAGSGELRLSRQEQYKCRWFLGWLLGPDSAAFGSGEEFIVDTWIPSYDVVRADRNASAWAPLFSVLGGVACDHDPPLAGNPVFRGLDLSGYEQGFGCGFCLDYRLACSELSLDPLTAVQTQLTRILATAPDLSSSRPVFHFEDIRLLREIDRLTDLVLSLAVPPAGFTFQPHLKLIPEIAHKLERVLPLLERAGHSLTLLPMGLETLIDEENLLLNKGFSLKQIGAAERTLRRLKAANLEAFHYDQSWTSITFTPWTTLQGLEQQIFLIRKRGYDPDGARLCSSLVLYRSVPLFELARKDGLVVEEWRDPAFLYGAFISDLPLGDAGPWRFKEPRMAQVFALVVRFCAAGLRDSFSDELFLNDPLYSRILEVGARHGFFARADEFALQVLAAVGSRASSQDSDQVLEIALEGYTREMIRTGYLREEAGQSRPAGESEPELDEEEARIRGVRQHKLEHLIIAVLARFPDRFKGVELRGIREQEKAETMGRDGGSAGILLDLLVDGYSYDLTLLPKAELPFFRTRRFFVLHRNQVKSGPEARQREATLKALVLVFEKALEQYARELLPG